MLAPPPRDADGKSFYQDHRPCRAQGRGGQPRSASGGSRSTRTAIFQAGARSVDAIIEQLDALHKRLRDAVGWRGQAGPRLTGRRPTGWARPAQRWRDRVEVSGARTGCGHSSPHRWGSARASGGEGGLRGRARPRTVDSPATGRGGRDLPVALRQHRNRHIRGRDDVGAARVVRAEHRPFTEHVSGPTWAMTSPKRRTSAPPSTIQASWWPAVPCRYRTVPAASSTTVVTPARAEVSAAVSPSRARRASFRARVLIRQFCRSRYGAFPADRRVIGHSRKSGELDVRTAPVC